MSVCVWLMRTCIESRNFFLKTGASLASFLLMPRNSVSMGASGAVFGLFMVSIFTRLQWDARRLLEGAILGNFVTQQVLQVSPIPSDTQRQRTTFSHLEVSQEWWGKLWVNLAGTSNLYCISILYSFVCRCSKGLSSISCWVQRIGQGCHFMFCWHRKFGRSRLF